MVPLIEAKINEVCAEYYAATQDLEPHGVSRELGSGLELGSGSGSGSGSGQGPGLGLGQG